jgi:hypothetical protein
MARNSNARNLVATTHLHKATAFIAPSEASSSHPGVGSLLDNGDTR